jgi:hypothetical protein
MWDTFRPLRLTALWAELDRPDYAYSWNPERGGDEPETATGAGHTTVTGPSA